MANWLLLAESSLLRLATPGQKQSWSFYKAGAISWQLKAASLRDANAAECPLRCPLSLLHGHMSWLMPSAASKQQTDEKPAAPFPTPDTCQQALALAPHPRPSYAHHVSYKHPCELPASSIPTEYLPSRHVPPHRARPRLHPPEHEIEARQYSDPQRLLGSARYMTAGQFRPTTPSAPR